MPSLKPPPYTHVLVRTLYDSTNERRPWYWRREMWLNDPVIGAQPPDATVDGKMRFPSQRAAMIAGLASSTDAIL